MMTMMTMIPTMNMMNVVMLMMIIEWEGSNWSHLMIPVMNMMNVMMIIEWDEVYGLYNEYDECGDADDDN